MGIIISSFPGCGKTYLTNSLKDKVKIMDATNIDNESVVDEVMGNVDKYDVVFVGSSEDIRGLFDERKIDYDVFYPSSNRRGEFIENQVRKRSNPATIRELDKDFEKLVQQIDDSEAENCYKHKLSNFGEFIGNDPSIMQYINSCSSKKDKNDDNKE